MSILTLYDITAELRDLQQTLYENGGEVTDEIEERFDDLLDAEEDKTEGYIAVIRELEASAEAVKTEEDRLKKRRKALQNAAESLTERLLTSMQIRDQDVRETDLGKVRRQTASRRPVVVSMKPEDLPSEFQRVSVRPDKKAIRKYMEENDLDQIYSYRDEIARLGEASEFLRIY